MVNKIIEIGGEERPINFGRNALCEFEKITGISILKGAGSDSLYTFDTIRALAFVGLKWGLYKGDGNEPKPSFTLFMVGEWFDDDANYSKIFTDSIPTSKNVVADASSPR